MSRACSHCGSDRLNVSQPYTFGGTILVRYECRNCTHAWPVELKDEECPPTPRAREYSPVEATETSYCGRCGRKGQMGAYVKRLHCGACGTWIDEVA